MSSGDEILVTSLIVAARQAFLELFGRHDEAFYYCSLVTDGEGNCPIISAWSIEALERVLIDEDDEDDVEKARSELKWSYADTPYYAFGEKYFEPVKVILEDRRALLEQDFQSEFGRRIQAMEYVMSVLDHEGVFGLGENRLCVVINAEVMPPDYGNTVRGKRLNPSAAIEVWLDEAAESEEMVC